jgi:hypothetical protein
MSNVKPRPDIYTALLSISLAAMILAIIFLVIEMGRYEWKVRAAAAPAPVAVGLA